MKDAEVMGVESVTHYKSCSKCQGRVDDLDGIIGVCCKCTMKQRLDTCVSNSSSRLLISAGTKQYYMTAFKTNIMQDFASQIEDMSDKDITTHLLMSKPFMFTYNVISDVFRDAD